jgi:hypothetical protein
MHKIVVVAGTATALALFGGWYGGLANTLLDDSNGAKSVCEAGVRSTLKAPSTYRRSDITFLSLPPLSFEQYKRYNITAGCIFSQFSRDTCTELPKIYLTVAAQEALKEKGVRRPTKRQIEESRDAVLRQQYSNFNKRPLDQLNTALVVVTYDAQNTFGVPIRGTATCRFGPAADSKQFTQNNIYDDSISVK